MKNGASVENNSSMSQSLTLGKKTKLNTI